jgi:hypothetical protein
MAGMVASLAGIPTKTNKEIRALIIQSADRYTTPTQYGYGIPDFSAALTSTLSVRISIKIILWLSKSTSDYISVQFRKVLIKEQLVLYHFRTEGFRTSSNESSRYFHYNH